MQLHEIKQAHPRQYKKPVIARGGKRGNTSGRGQKGQKSRSGHRMRPAERDYIMRLPKLRGYKNKPLGQSAQVVNVGDLARVTGVVTPASLRAAGLIRNVKRPVKILGDGAVTIAVTVQKISVSAGAKKKIEAAGGKIVS